MSAEPLTAAVENLPPRTWRQWWGQLPSWKRSLALGFAAVVAIHLAAALRIVIGWQEERGLARLRRCGIRITYAWDRKPELFRGQRLLFAGLFGRSARNVTQLDIRWYATLYEQDLKFIGARCVNLRVLRQAAYMDPSDLMNDFPDSTPDDDDDDEVEISFEGDSIREEIPAQIDISAAGLTALKGCRRLKSLDLSNTDITDDVVRQLLPLTELESIDLSGTCVSNDVVEILVQFPKLKHVTAKETLVSHWATGETELRHPGRNLQITGAMIELVKEFQGTVRWSDGEQTARLPLPVEFYVEGPPDAAGDRPMYRRYIGELTRPALYVSPTQLTDWGDGDYHLALKLGRYDAAPVTVRVHNNTAATHRVEFRMPVTKAEALRNRR